MSTPAAGRGGSPPRPAGPPAPRPAQWFIFGPFLYDIDHATRLLADAPRPARPLPVTAWARACGLDREPGADPHTIALIGPGPGFDPGYAMGTDLAQPLIIATLTPAGQRPAPLLIDGAHRLYKAYAEGVAELPAWVLTAAETMAIRQPSRPRPARPKGRPWRFLMTEITVTIWHNIRTDPGGRHPATLDGYTPGDPMVRVFTYQTHPRGRSPGQIAEDAFAAFNGHPADAEGAALAGEYYDRQLRSLSFPGK